MAKLKIGQTWQDVDDGRRFKITHLARRTVRYVEVIGKQARAFITSRIQWEFDVDRGQLKEVKE